ncbi:MAG: efflux RND transporter periplasmic adaptor subunit [Granulosicoccus sp.]
MWKGVLVVLLAAGLAITVYGWQQGDTATSVSTRSVTKGSVDARLELTGVVTNDRTVTLTALLDGEIMSIRAREGDVVETGAILAELDSRQARALLDRARAELVLQEQAVEAATRNLERIRRISLGGNTSRQSLDDRQDAQLAAQAALRVARADLTLNQLLLDNAYIRAPFAGTVIEKRAETGQWLEAGTPVFTLVASEGTVIEAEVSATDWSRIRLGQRVTLSSEVNAGAQWQSDIQWIAPSVSANNGEGLNVAVRIPPGEDAPQLLLGQEVDVDVSVQKVDDVLVVPLQVLSEGRAGEFRAFVLDDEGRARLRQVTIGLTSLDDAQVIQGLSEGEQVIVPAGLPLQDGQAVQVR